MVKDILVKPWWIPAWPVLDAYTKLLKDLKNTDVTSFKNYSRMNLVAFEVWVIQPLDELLMVISMLVRCERSSMSRFKIRKVSSQRQYL